MTFEKELRLEQSMNSLPRAALAVRPTPLEALPRLSERLGGPPIYMKRDDLTGLAFGGNKTRMLELSLADALDKGADTIVFGAAVQSNYCRQLAAACAKLGLELHLVLRVERAIDKKEIQGNQLLQRLFGAQVTLLDGRDRPKQKAAIAAKAAQLRQAGKKVYVPRQADTIDLDVIAYAESALELVRQARELEIEPQALYVTALDTTQAGLVLGLKYLDSHVQVKGISPTDNEPGRFERMATMSNQAAARLDLDVTFMGSDFDNDDSFVGERYGIPTEAGLEALHMVAQTEGILLDPVYTSKGMSALISHVRSGQLSSEQPIVFMHTGGAPALFGYASDVLPR